MLKLLLLLAAAASVFGSTATAPENEAIQGKQGRIIGGQITTIASVPYLVSILIEGLHHCGGVIITTSLILTTANCVIDKSHLKIRAGSTYWNSGGIVIDVEAVKIHERFSLKTRDNDIAVLRLVRSLPLGYTIRTIPLATVTPPSGATAFVAGWGETTPGAPPKAVTLHYTSVNIVGRVNCTSAKYDYGNKIRLDMICANAPGRDTCRGDAGGPLVIGYTLAGITSWGYGCANSNYPGVYVNVAYHWKWIQNAGRRV